MIPIANPAQLASLESYFSKVLGEHIQATPLPTFKGELGSKATNYKGKITPLQKGKIAISCVIGATVLAVAGVAATITLATITSGYTQSGIVIAIPFLAFGSLAGGAISTLTVGILFSRFDCDKEKDRLQVKELITQKAKLPGGIREILHLLYEARVLGEIDKPYPTQFMHDYGLYESGQSRLPELIHQTGTLTTHFHDCEASLRDSYSAWFSDGWQTVQDSFQISYTSMKTALSAAFKGHISRLTEEYKQVLDESTTSLGNPSSPEGVGSATTEATVTIDWPAFFAQKDAFPFIDMDAWFTQHQQKSPEQQNQALAHIRECTTTIRFKIGPELTPRGFRFFARLREKKTNPSTT